MEALGATVRYGPFAGLKFPSASQWGVTDRGSMLLGLYEQEILESLAKTPKDFRTFIDIGAADGYYGVGVLVGGLFEHSYCFEMNERSRELIREAAVLNGVEKRIEVHGTADRNFYDLIPAERREKSVLFLDVEGAEFSLLEKRTFEVFSRSIIFVELHEFYVEDGPQKLKRLLEDASATHSVTQFRTSSRDLSAFPELAKLNDNDRWMLCSEGRPLLMSWLRFAPKH